ncbi:MAG TPA: histidinol dehydrogenase [Lentisphaeria bacterium]|nr:MAG: histidinol dehydrogenase [Lentisphaerae bacterium GWF2_38_69]HBM17392.1 histidinol dehydrogenase [Lentisphaeria bacterium]
MKIISYREKDFKDKLNKLFYRKAFSDDIAKETLPIIEDVKNRGDIAISEYIFKFDKASIEPGNFLLTEEEINEAEKKVSESKKNAILTAIENVTDFALRQKPKNWKYSPRTGVELGEKFSPFSRIGAYIPGGTAPLVSTSIHTMAIAKAAGVKNIIGTTPPDKEGKINPELIYAMKQSGAVEIYKMGGVYAIAALAYGTQSIRKVEKIVGPGNAYVTAAKKFVYGEVAIDMIAGPSEVMIIADISNNPDFVAADLLSQAEHGSGHEQAVLISTSHALIERVKDSLEKQMKKLNRAAALKKVTSESLVLIETESVEQSIEIANSYAPEHLEIMCKDNEKVSDNITAAGAIFLGEYTPESVGDFVAGPSHVLPTGGSARYFSGITIETFLRRSSLIKYSKQALEREIPFIERFADMEGLDAHGNSALIRFGDYIGF